MPLIHADQFALEKTYDGIQITIVQDLWKLYYINIVKNKQDQSDYQEFISLSVYYCWYWRIIWQILYLPSFYHEKNLFYANCKVDFLIFEILFQDKSPTPFNLFVWFNLFYFSQIIYSMYLFDINVF